MTRDSVFWHELTDALARDGACDRRDFLRLLAASMALAGTTGCTLEASPDIVPYVVQPHDVTIDTPRAYATSMLCDGHATGLLVKAREGRPIKIEGNPAHPAGGGGGSSVQQQAALLSLYDPHRARAARSGAMPVGWHSLVQDVRAALGKDDGAGAYLLLEPHSSPLDAAAASALSARYPRLRCLYHAPFAQAACLDATRLACGAERLPMYRFERADVVVALDADIVSEGAFHLTHARALTERRGVRATAPSRLHVAESALTPTGALADARLAIASGDIDTLARELLARLEAAEPTPSAAESPRVAWLDDTARLLRQHPGRSVVVAGDRQPLAVHLAALACNALLGNIAPAGPLGFIAPQLTGASDAASGLATLCAALEGGEAHTVIMLGGNPVYTASSGVDLRRALPRARLSLYLGMYENETAQATRLFVPQAHFLESWGLSRAYDGTLSLTQPLIRPLYDGKTPGELLTALAYDAPPTARDRIAALVPDLTRALKRGFVASSAAPVEAPQCDVGAVRTYLAAHAPTVRTAETIEVNWRADLRVGYGESTNNPWLLELPEPLTTLTWDNAAVVSPRTAEALGAATGDLLTLEVEATKVIVPALVLPGHADGALTVTVGFGRSGAEQNAAGVGFDAYRLRPSTTTFFAPGQVTRASGRHALALAQPEMSMHARPLVLDQAPEPHEEPSLRSAAPTPTSPGPQWGMVIDLGRCTGCSACVVACQAENNVPVVGKANVLKHRQMHWLRIDRYIDTAADGHTHAVRLQPMACQHCENAPCEYVCPVAATTHSPDGLNQMVYNRCVGTRFCSNNCPYKVRRFNYFHYTAAQSPTQRLANNPDVTVRARGVMEKCTYCVQRIRAAQKVAKRAQRHLTDADVQPACAQACATEAIVFGDLTQADSAATRLRRGAYALLDDQGTRPRTQYLPRGRRGGETP